MRPFGIYIHVPFCRIKCAYCDFYTHSLVSSEAEESFVKALLSELDQPERLGWQSGRPLRSIFLGGGTPSLLHPESVRIILKKIFSRFTPEKKIEITIESNPESVAEENSLEWHEMGINRVSLGVQTLEDRALEKLGRAHDSQKAAHAYDRLRKSGFENISVDLMYGLENQSTKKWMDSLKTVISWKPNHLSAYQLTVEGKTRFGTELRSGRLKLPSDNRIIGQYQSAVSFLKDAGYERYEISNFATSPNEQSKHNLLYWRGEEYWGVGPSAHSFQFGDGVFHRFWNPRDTQMYLKKWIDSKDANPLRETETLTAEMHWGERLMVGLRLTEGIDLLQIEEQLGVPIPKETQENLDRMVESGWITRKDTSYRLTDSGLLLSNEIFVDLL